MGDVMSEKIILVDDDSNILASVSVALRAEGWLVETYNDGEQGLIALQRNPPDIAILDIKMPRLDGMEVLKKLRESSDIPVIFLTSKDDEIDEAFGLRMGADDYITKPIRPKVLISRIKALLRRKSKSNDLKLDVIQFDELKIDRGKYQVFKGERLLEMPRKEFELLYMLASAPGKVFTRDVMMDKIWGSEVIVGGWTIDVHIAKIREKIGDKMIKTIKGVGYKMGE